MPATKPPTPDWQSPRRSTVTPMIMVKGAMDVMDFAIDIFGAELVSRPLMRENGTLWNAEIRIGDSTIMLTEPQDDHQVVGFIYVHAPNADAIFERAIAKGAMPILAPQDQFYGEHDGGFADAQGNIWWVATHKEVLSDDEVEERARAFERQKKDA